VYICNSKILEMDLLVMLILIILATWIRRNLSHILFLWLMVVMLARTQVCRLLLFCLLHKLIYDFFEFVKKLFG
jgi:hypothetical protein